MGGIADRSSVSTPNFTTMTRIVLLFSFAVLLAISASPLSEQTYEEINQVESHKAPDTADEEVDEALGDANDMGGSAAVKFAARADLPPAPKDPVRDPMLRAIRAYDEQTIIKPDTTHGHSLVDTLEGINEEITPKKASKKVSAAVGVDKKTSRHLATRISESGNIKVNLRDISPQLMNTKWTAHVNVPFRIDVHNKFIC